MDYIPVISVSFGLEKNPGFQLSVSLIRKLIYAMMYGDLIMNVANQVRPYEVQEGQTDALVQTWQNKLVDTFQHGKGMSRGQMKKIFPQICQDFAAIEVAGEPKIRVGVVGEIYVKFSSLGNNNLERFLLKEGAEPVVPGLTDFIIFKIYNREVDVDIYGGSAGQAGGLPVLQALCGKVPAGHDRRAQILRPLPARRAPLPTCTAGAGIPGRRLQDGRRLAAHG